MTQPMKDQARRLAAHLARVHDIKLLHGHALEAVAAAHGFESWNAAVAGSEGPTIPESPRLPYTTVDVRFRSAGAAADWLENHLATHDAVPWFLVDRTTLPSPWILDPWSREYVERLLTLAFGDGHDPETYFGAVWLLRATVGTEEDPSVTVDDLLHAMCDLMETLDDGPGALDEWVQDLFTMDPELAHLWLIQAVQARHNLVRVRAHVGKRHAYTLLCPAAEVPARAKPDYSAVLRRTT